MARYTKAIAAFFAPGCALIIANGGHMSGNEWIVAGATCVVAGAAVYVAPANKG